jgi:hypothetical protein
VFMPGPLDARHPRCHGQARRPDHRGHHRPTS